MKTSDFDYELPPELIASYPAERRSDSRLLHLPADAPLADRDFRDLPELLRPGDLLVFNDTRVIKARLPGFKSSGGRIEVLVERVLDETTVLAQIGASNPPRPGSRLRLADAFEAEVLGREAEFYRLRFHGDAGALDLIERHGAMPLPPYMDRPAEAADAERYQTVYARHPGAVAAPTAGLHFDPPTLDALAARGIASAWLTLHVGAGTFRPVKVESLAEHRMHSERYTLPEATAAALEATRAAGGRIVAVGTTSLRALEAAARDGLRAGAGETAIFIYPGHRFQVVDLLLTNFHLPRSTLLMLVSALAGREPVLAAYAHAVARRYRFFSYGDAMLVERRTGGGA